MASVPKPLDYQAYLRTPEIRRRYDIIDGEFHFMAPSPGWSHQQAVGQVFELLKRHVDQRRLGHVLMAPFDVIIAKNPMRTRQPDVLYVSEGRLKLIDDRLHSAPDLVVEILSPGNSTRKVAEKLRDYASIGVREAWVADPKAKTLTVLHPGRAGFRETAVGRPGERVRSKVLPRLRLDVGKIFRR